MNILESLEGYLEKNFNIDYWSDEALHHATNLIRSLPDTDWSQLSKIWNQKPIQWQARLAEALYGSEDKRAIELLIQMLNSKELPVAIAAAESLEAKDYIWHPDESLRKVLEQLSSKVEGNQQNLIRKLINSIK